MTSVQFRYDRDTYRKMGEDKYQRLVMPKLSEANRGKFLAIDIESGEFEIAEDELLAVTQLRERIPDAQPWLVCAGYDYLHRMGRASDEELSKRIHLRKS